MLTGTSECQTTASCTGAADEVKSTIGYDANGNMTSVSKGSGNGSLTATSTMTYTAMGDVQTLDGPLAGTADTTRYRYDAARRRIGVIDPDPDGAGPAKHRATRFLYRPSGILAAEQLGTVTDNSDPAWAAFAMAYQRGAIFDTNDRMVRQTLWDGTLNYSVVDYVYDPAGRVSCTVTNMDPSNWGPGATSCIPTQQNGPNGPDRVTQTVYDSAGRVSQIKVAVGVAGQEAAERTLTYTNNGRLQTLKDAENNLTTYEYDGHDRLSKTRYPNLPKGSGTSSTTDFEQPTYDAASNVISFRNRANEVTSFTFDNLNRVTFKNLPGAEPDVTYVYDNLNRLTSSSVPSYTLTFGYDALSRQTFDGQGWGSISRTFDLAGRLTRTTWWDGFYVDYQRQVTGELVAVRENGAFTGPGVLASYFYDDLRRRTSLWRGNGTVTYWAYDPVSRLASMTHDLAGTGSDLTQTFSYNPAHQFTQSVRSNDSYAWTGHGSGSTAYTANGLNQLATISGSATTHDARGNLTSDPTRGQTYAYSSENQLKSASGGISAYYDPLGRLTEYDTNVSRRFMSDGPQIAVEIDNPNSNVVRRFVWGDAPDELIVEYTGSGTSNRRWAHVDERGSIIAYSDASGAATINKYDEFGRPQSGNWGVFQYTGQMWLPELGLYNYKARNYAPHLGRFVQTDPMGYADSPNLYVYVLNNPVSFVDPFGMDCGTTVGSRIRRCTEGGTDDINAGLLMSGSLGVHPNLVQDFDSGGGGISGLLGLAGLTPAFLDCGTNCDAIDLLHFAGAPGAGQDWFRLTDERHAHILTQHGIQAALNFLTLQSPAKGVLSPSLWGWNDMRNAIAFVVNASPAFPAAFGRSRYEAQLPYMAGISRTGVPTNWLTVITQPAPGLPGTNDIWTIFPGRQPDPPGW